MEQKYEPQEHGGYYGTGRRETDKSHLPLIVVLLSLILAANLVTVAVHAELRNRTNAESAPSEESTVSRPAAYPARDTYRKPADSGKTLLGMEISELNEAERRYWELPEGVIVHSVTADGGAANAGVLPGDLLLTVCGKAVTDTESYLAAVTDCNAGDTVPITIFRRGTYYEIDLTLRAE